MFYWREARQRLSTTRGCVWLCLPSFLVFVLFFLTWLLIGAELQTLYVTLNSLSVSGFELGTDWITLCWGALLCGPTLWSIWKKTMFSSSSDFPLSGSPAPDESKCFKLFVLKRNKQSSPHFPIKQLIRAEMWNQCLLCGKQKGVKYNASNVKLVKYV